jgi:hypothetical protein
MILLGAMALPALLTGCVSVTPETAAGQTIPNLCLAVLYGNNQVGTAESGAAALAELRSRGLFSNAEIEQIARSRPAPGMSESAGLCAWGYAQNGVNTTVTAGGTSKQFTYGDGVYSPLRYLYTTNGRVTAVQD